MHGNLAYLCNGRIWLSHTQKNQMRFANQLQISSGFFSPLSRLKFFGQFGNLVDSFVQEFDRIFQRLVCRDVNAGNFGRFNWCWAIVKFQEFEPCIDCGLTLFLDFQISLSRNRQTCRIGVWIKSHIIMRLAHPRQGCVIVNFNRIAPEFLQDGFFDFAKSDLRQNLRRYRSAYRLRVGRLLPKGE